MSPAAAYACDSTRLSRWSSQAGTGHPDRALATLSATAAARPWARPPYAAASQATALISLSGGYAKGCVCLLEPAVRLAQLIVFQVHPGQGDKCGGAGVRDGRPRLTGGQGRGRLGGHCGRAAELAAQSLRQREVP